MSTQLKLIEHHENERVAIFRLADQEPILRLRQSALYPEKPVESVRMADIHDDEVWHVALFETGEERFMQEPESPICCATFIRSSYKESPAWRLYGMATARERRSQGLGRLLLRDAEQAIVTETGISDFWCHARIEAVAFLRRQGWKYDHPEIYKLEGRSHYRLKKTVAMRIPEQILS